MTGLTLVAMLLSVAALGLALNKATTAKLILCAAILLAHVSACIYYYYYALYHVADSYGYYYDPYQFWNQPWGLGTVFVAQLTHALKTKLGASYFDCFLLYQTFSLAGIALLARIFDEIEGRIGVLERRGYWILLFVPSLHFWTVAIGKDAPLLFATSLCVWAMLDLRKRFRYFCVAMAVMVLFRAHIALMAVISVAAAAFFGSSMSVGRKFGVFAFAIAGMLLVIGPVQDTLNADVSSASGVQDFLNAQSQIGANYEGTTSIGQAGFALKFVSLLFRPLFFDAVGLLGVLASMENLLVVFVFLYVLIHWRDLLFLMRRVFFIRFIIAFATIILLGLTLIYYNVGLGLRERVMVYPMVYSLLVALWSLRRKRALAAALPAAEHLMVDPSANRALIEL